MQDNREKLINMAREGLDSDFIQMMEEKDKERREEFQRLYGDKTIREQSQISAKQLFDAIYEPFKKRYLLPNIPNIGNFLDSFYRELELVLFSAKAVSICGLECDTIELKYENLALETIRDIKVKLNINLSNAISIIEGVTIGMYKPDPYEPPARNSNLTSMDNFCNKMAYDLKYRDNPLFVAKTNIDIYREIINKLETDEKVLFKESKNKIIITQPSHQAEDSKPQWKARALFRFYREKANEKSFSYQDTLAYFKCQDISGTSNYKQLTKNYLEMASLKDRCLPTNREYIFTAIQELEKLESCKKALGIARAEYDDFNVNYPIAIK